MDPSSDVLWARSRLEAFVLVRSIAAVMGEVDVKHDGKRKCGLISWCGPGTPRACTTGFITGNGNIAGSNIGERSCC